MKNIKYKLLGRQQLQEFNLENQDPLQKDNTPRFDVPITGMIYGALLNYKGEVEAISDTLHQEPYKAPPKAPILYIKPENTKIAHKMPIPLPANVAELQVGAALGIVIGRTASKVSIEEAFDYIDGYTIVNDISIPHESVYRPAISQKARDGFCPVGPYIVEKHSSIQPDRLKIQVFINNELCQENTTANLIRPVAQLLSEMTSFMTLDPGDVVLVGVPEHPPLVKAGDHIRIEIEQIGVLENQVVREEELRLGVSP